MKRFCKVSVKGIPGTGILLESQENGTSLVACHPGIKVGHSGSVFQTKGVPKEYKGKCFWFLTKDLFEVKTKKKSKSK